MDPKKLFEAIQNLPELRRLEAEDFVRYLAEREREGKPTQGMDAIQWYLDHPLIIENVKAPTREELYQGR